jgi:hypothetical protein
LLDRFLPTTVPIVTAAILAGMTRETFRKLYIETGLLNLDIDHRVPLTALASALGRVLDMDDVLEANAKREPERKAQRQRDRAKRAA